MARQPHPVHPESEKWVGARVRYYCPHRYSFRRGTVTRAASGKVPAVWVLFDNDDHDKYLYVSEYLEKDE